MPQFLEFPVKNRKDFEAIKRRYDAKSFERYPAQWNELVSSWKHRDYPLSLGIGDKNFGFFGSLREWMGLEKLLITFYDDPMLIHEMMDFVLESLTDTIHRAVEDVDIDRVDLWEDMGYKTGPLISPAMFREFMLPRYKRLTTFLRTHWIDVIFVDSDGNVNELVPLWLEGGVNGLLPLEVQAGMDPRVLMRKYGKNILLIGGIDKKALAKGKNAIEEKVMLFHPMFHLRTMPIIGSSLQHYQNRREHV